MPVKINEDLKENDISHNYLSYQGFGRYKSARNQLHCADWDPSLFPIMQGIMPNPWHNNNFCPMPTIPSLAVQMHSLPLRSWDCNGIQAIAHITTLGGEMGVIRGIVSTNPTLFQHRETPDTNSNAPPLPLGDRLRGQQLCHHQGGHGSLPSTIWQMD